MVPADGPIVLVHGILGFGHVENGPLPQFVHYFNGVAHYLRTRGFTVHEPFVNPVGSIVQRGGMLAAYLKQLPLRSGEQAQVIAHSMGGLDARQAMTREDGVKERVRGLATICTPHRGSPVADRLDGVVDPQLQQLPQLALNLLRTHLGGLHDLTTGAARAFDDATPDVGGVSYVNVTGDALVAGPLFTLFPLAQIVRRLTNEPNDGVVTVGSGLKSGHAHRPIWPVDHWGAIGWNAGSIVSPSQHLRRYGDLVAGL